MTKLQALLHTSLAKVILVVVAFGLAIGAGMAISGAFSSDSSPADVALAPTEPVTQSALNVAVAGLCSMRTNLQQGQLTDAHNIFYDKSHLFLHQLAAAVEKKDINQASNLLLAKYRVEDLISTFGATPAASPTPAAASPVDLVGQLLQQVQASAVLLGLQSPSCQE